MLSAQSLGVDNAQRRGGDLIGREPCHDVAAAVEHLKSRPEADGGRIGLWGTSLGGMNVIRVAAARTDVAVAVVQCPIVHGPGAARRLGLRAR